MTVEVLFLSMEDISKLLDMSEVISVVEEAFREKCLGRVIMPPKLYLIFKEFNGDFRCMPAYIKKFNIAGVKIVNVHPLNPRKYGLPTVMAVIELIDPLTGKPLALMDGTLITAYRTGAAGGIAIKYLARKDSKIIGMVASGTQARTQLLAAYTILGRKIELVKVYDIIREKAERFKREMEDKLNINIEVVDSIKEAVENVDILITTTPSRKPIVKAEWIKPGLHINAIGADAPGKEELDPQILKMSKIVVDDYEQAIHSGEINVPIAKGIISKEDIYAELGEIIAGLKPGRVSSEEITVFDSTGLAIQDVATAWLIYEKAKKKGIGTWFKLF